MRAVLLMTLPALLAWAVSAVDMLEKAGVQRLWCTSLPTAVVVPVPMMTNGYLFSGSGGRTWPPGYSALAVRDRLRLVSLHRRARRSAGTWRGLITTQLGLAVKSRSARV